jgi:RNA ligase
LTGFSNITIWEYLKDKRDFNEFLDRVPDEFDSWVRNTVEDIKNEYEMINSEYKWIFQVLMRSSQSETKKGFAEMAKKYKHPSILFKMFDGKEYSNYIWKQIRPNYQKPFRKELEN